MRRIPSIPSINFEFDSGWTVRRGHGVGLIHVRLIRLRGSSPTFICLALVIALTAIGSLQVAESTSRGSSTVDWVQSTAGTVSCVDGTYANPVGPAPTPTAEPGMGLCLPCSHCGPGLYVAHPCQSTRDTVCDSCHTYRGPHNRDFQRRCRGPDGVIWSVFGKPNVTSPKSAIYTVTQSTVSSSGESHVAPPADEYQWLRVTVNCLFVVLVIALCCCVIVLYHIKRSPVNGYKVITKVEDV